MPPSYQTALKLPPDERDRRAAPLPAHPVPDRYWNEAGRALLRHVREGDRVLIPAGDWGALPFETHFYRAEDCDQSLTGHDALLLHKAMLATFRQSDLAQLVSDRAIVFANRVFVLFVSRPRSRSPVLPWHLRPLRIYLDPLRYRRANPQSCAFLHMPKAAGTSVWNRIARSVGSRIYFASDAQLAAFDGDINAFEAVGGHIHAETLIASGWRGPAFFVLRDPADRLLSFVAHARRPGEDLAALGESFACAAETASAETNATLHVLLRDECSIQTRALGLRDGESLADPHDAEAVLHRAFARLGAAGWHYALVEEPAHLARQVARCFGLGDRALPRDNRTARRHRLGEADAETIERTVREVCAASPDMQLYRRARALPMREA